ncbi:MAG: potassium-transporting ATPase, subunit [Acidobacteria bacterium]|nr:potassium-transporting ATPase, subunit [Acidobacteriota bacterium]
MKIAVRMTLLLLVLTCGIYPALVWAIGQVVFRDQANGSLLVRGGRAVGSSLIGQPFGSERYFHPRPGSYDGMASGGSNLGPTSRALRDRIAGSVAGRANVPADEVTTSASGLDPHISPENALRQVPRVAHARDLDEAIVRSLVERRIEGRFLGVYGEPRVNVLLLNLALDEMRASHGARE